MSRLSSRSLCNETFSLIAVSAVFVVSAGAFPTAAQAQQWTRFRGPNGSGACEADNIATTWTTKDYRWRVKLPGIGNSSPVVQGNRIFVTSALEEDGTRIVRCLATSDGHMIWKRQFPSKTFDRGKADSYDSASPTVDSERVYLKWTTPDDYVVMALDIRNGREVWCRNLGPFEAEHGGDSSPILFDDLLIVVSDQLGQSFVAALDCRSGETRWKVDRRSVKAAYSTPCIYQPAADGPNDGRPQLILSGMTHGISSLDPTTGRSNWEIDVFDLRVVASPLITPSGLIVGSCGVGGGGKRTVAVRPPTSDIDKPEVVYEFEKSLPYVPTAICYRGLLFLWSDSGVVTCADEKSGDIVWQKRVGGKFFGSPIRVQDRLYCMSREGQMIVLAAANEYRLLAKIDLEEPTNATPAVAGGTMYLRTRSHLMALGSGK